MLENLKEKLFRNKENQFITLVSSVVGKYTLHDYYDEYTSALIESYYENNTFIEREEIALYLAFHLHVTRTFKSLGNETELNKIYETAEKASKEIIIKAKEQRFDKIFDKINLQDEFKINRLNRIDFISAFFKRFENYNELIESKKDIIRVYLPNENCVVYPNPKEFSYVDLAINRFNLPIGFLRIGFDYYLMNKNSEKHYTIGLRSTKRMRELLDFNDNTDYNKAIKDDWTLTIVP